MKKILTILGIITLFGLPIVSYATIGAGWSATSTSAGQIYPTKINGVEQTVRANNFIATSTTATSTLPIINSTTLLTNNISPSTGNTINYTSANTNFAGAITTTVFTANTATINLNATVKKSFTIGNFDSITTPATLTLADVYSGSTNGWMQAIGQWNGTGVWGIGTTNLGTDNRIRIGLSTNPTCIFGVGCSGFFDPDQSAFKLDVGSSTLGNNLNLQGVVISSSTTATSTFPNASTTKLIISGLTNSFLAVNGIGQVIATSTPSSLSGGTTNWLTYWTSPTTIGATSSPVVGRIIATSTTLSSVLPQASTTNLSVSNNAYVASKLGIGVTSALSPLHVKGDFLLEGNPTPRIYAKSNDGNSLVFNRYSGQESYPMYFGENGDTGNTFFRAQGTFYFGDQTTPAITAIGSSGKVGIKGITSPTYDLQVGGTFAAKTDGGGATEYPNSTSFTVAHGNIAPGSVTGYWGSYTDAFYDDGVGNILTSGDDHQIGTIDYATGYTETDSYFGDVIDEITYTYDEAIALATTPDGKVGIGTVSPTSGLTINHAANETTTFLNTAISDINVMSFGYNGTTGEVVWNARSDFPLVIQDSAIGNGKLGIHINAGSAYPLSNLDVGGNVAMGAYAGVTAAPSNGLIVSGNVGIGTSSPSARLDVNGTFKLQGSSTVETATIGGAIVGLGCDTGDTVVPAGIVLSSTTAFITTPEADPGIIAAPYSIAISSTTIRTKVCSGVTVTPNTVKYIVKIIF